MLKYRFFSILTFFFIAVWAQEPVLLHLTEKDGLPDKEFYNFLEDSKGFVWLASDKGLYRYDGKEYKLFTHPEQVGMSVFCLFNDNDTIWFTNLANQVFKVNGDNVELVTTEKDVFASSLFDIYIHKDLLIISNFRRIIVLDKTSLKVLYEGKVLNNYAAESPLLFGKDEFSYSLKDEIITYNLLNNTVNYKERSKEYAIRSLRTAFSQLPSGQNIGTFRKVDGTNSFRKFSSLVKEDFQEVTTELDKINMIINGIKTIDDMVLVLTNVGAFQCSMKQNTLVFHQRFLENNEVTDAFKDKNGNIWFSTLNSGIYIAPNLSINLNYNCPEYNSIRKMLFGKENEIFLLGQEKEFYRYDTSKNRLDILADSDARDLKYIYNIPSTDRYLYQNTLGNYKINIENNKLIFGGDKIRSFGVVKDHTQVNDSLMLLSTGGSFGVYDKNRIYTHERNRFWFSDPTRSYSCNYSKKYKKAYFGTVNGLFSLNDTFDKKEIRYYDEPIYAKDIVARNNGSVWCLSFKKGLYKIIDNKVVSRYDTSNGLLSNINYFIAIDELNSTLWIAGEKGIQELDLEDKKIRSLTKKDGIPSYEFVGLKVVDSMLFVGTQDKLFSFNTQTVFEKEKTMELNPYFTAVTVDGQQLELNDFYEVEHDAKQIQIGYNTNGFQSNENVSYEYRLVEGSDPQTKWQKEPSKSNKIVYNRLAEGSYEFQIRALRDDLISEPISFNLKVKGVFL